MVCFYIKRIYFNKEEKMMFFTKKEREQIEALAKKVLAK